MNRIPALILLLLLRLPLLTGQPLIILKLDDLRASNNECTFLPTLKYLADKEIKAGLGAIATDFDSTAQNLLLPFLQAKDSLGQPLFEIWNHGFDHVRPEFSGTGYEYQKRHYTEAAQKMKACLGIQMHSFGAPYNDSDSVCNRVLAEDTACKVFMFARIYPPAGACYIILRNRVNMENGTGNPEFRYFLENYRQYNSVYTDYMVLQGHPNLWTAEQLNQFDQIIAFLRAEGCRFVLPFEYYNEEIVRKQDHLIPLN